MNRNIVHELRAFGLSEWEARSYFALATRGSLSATTISTISHIPVSKVYDVLRNLKHKSFAAVKSTKPYRWCAIDPAEVFKIILDSKKNTTNTLESKALMLSDKLKMATKSLNFETWMATGNKAFFDKFVDMLKRTNSECCIVTDKFTRNEDIDAAINAAIARGVKIRMLTTTKLDSISSPRAEWYANSGVSLGQVQLDAHPVIEIIENKEAIIRIDNNDYIWSNHPAVIVIVKDFFEKIWTHAKPLKFEN